MTEPRKPTLFVCYAHEDRPVACRLRRRLTAHAVSVTLDEGELPTGSPLAPAITAQLREADALLVIASQASAASERVRLELDLARAHGQRIIPVFIEPLTHLERFRDHEGLDATSPQEFADTVQTLLRQLYRAGGPELPPTNATVLEAGLRELAKAQPVVAPLILGCLDSQGLPQDDVEAVMTAPFHALDEALDSLFELDPSPKVALHAGYGFQRAGAGVRALSRWIAKSGDGGLPLQLAIGTRSLAPALFPVALKLLEGCTPPNNNALYNFIAHNADRLDEAQRQATIRLTIRSVQANTAGDGDLVGWMAFKAFPDNLEIQHMWLQWIHGGAFDGRPDKRRNLAEFLAEANQQGWSGWEPIAEGLRVHVHALLRSGDEDNVWIATEHLKAAAKAKAPSLKFLFAEANGVAGTAEWEGWRRRAPEAAERSGHRNFKRCFGSNH